MNILQLPLFLFIGYILQKIIPENLQEQTADYLNKFVIYISLPALVLVYMLDLEFDSTFLLSVVSIWGMFIIVSFMVWVISRKLGWTRSLTGAMLMLVPFGNTSFLGIPFTQAYFGDQGIPYAIICDQLGSFLILSTVGLVILSVYSSQEASVSRILKRVLSFPAFIALVFTLFFNSDMFPLWLMDILEFLAATLTPVALLAIGLYLKLRLDRDKLVPFFIAIGLKLIFVPLVLILVFTLWGMDGLVAEVTVFEAGMAPMVSSSMLAIAAGLEKRFVASVLGYGLVFSFLTLPVLFYLIKNIL